MTDTQAELAIQEEALEDQSNEYLEETRSLPAIRSNVQYENVAERLKTAKRLEREIKGFFKPIKQKMDAAKKEVLDKEKETLAPVEEAVNLCKKLMGVWEDKQEKKRLAEEARLAEKAKQQAEELGVSEEEIAVSEPRTKKPKVEGVSSRKIAKFRVVDADKIHRRFLIPDEKKIGQLVRSTGKDAEEIVGGIEVYFDKSFRVS
jgi:hypothetical protein